MVDTVNHKENSSDYILCQVNRGGNLVIQNRQENSYFIRTASEILTDQHLVKGFSPQELMQIKAWADDS